MAGDEKGKVRGIIVVRLANTIVIMMSDFTAKRATNLGGTRLWGNQKSDQVGGRGETKSAEGLPQRYFLGCLTF